MSRFDMNAQEAADTIEQMQTRIGELEQREEELTAALEAIKIERDMALYKFYILADKHGEPESYKCVVYDLDDPKTKIKEKLISLGWVPPESINAVRRETYADGFYGGYVAAWDSEHSWQQDYISYGLEQSEIEAAQRYPGKE